MVVTIRPQSADDPALLSMLRFAVNGMLTRLYAEGIVLADNTVKIWVKEHERTGKRYPKIEFDAHGQELQYGLDDSGQITEAHFKSFDKANGRISRSDIEKPDACELLRRIDDILRPPEDGAETRGERR